MLFILLRDSLYVYIFLFSLFLYLLVIINPLIRGKSNQKQNQWWITNIFHKSMNLFSFQVTPQIDQLILIDRSVDLITPLATQLTYEGLIDQFFQINNCEYHCNLKYIFWKCNFPLLTDFVINARHKQSAFRMCKTLMSSSINCSFWIWLLP